MFIGQTQAYSATADLATWAGCSNEKTPPQLQILNWSEPYENVGGAIAIASLRKAPPTTIFSLFRRSKISIHLQKTLHGNDSPGFLRSQYTYKKELHAADSPRFLVLKEVCLIRHSQTPHEVQFQPVTKEQFSD